ncbi:deoxyuridine triphosphatase (dut) [Vairimorpha necatrix]|uniref:Deoxyuridine 5'-triphosphate nucleotidohydrolase n=1 Tax=Vairimorpha necatrix TaxID=6039 RepID=A0AAX4JC32_9MICR
MTFSKLKITKLSKSAKIPERHSEGAAGYDISVLESGTINPKEISEIRTGLIFSIPKNHLGIIFGRSGLALKHGLEPINSKILPESNEELKVKILNNSNVPFEYTAGMRIAQMVIIKTCEYNIEEVECLESSTRGDSGFGSTGLH